MYSTGRKFDVGGVQAHVGGGSTLGRGLASCPAEKLVVSAIRFGRF